MYKVVIVEDSKLLRNGMKYTIDWESLGCVVVGDAENGQQGLSLVRRVQPDIVITDIQMPGLNGLQMIEQLVLEQNPAVYIIISAYDEFSYAQQAVRFGVADYIVKPFTDEEMAETVQTAARRVTVRRENEALRQRLATVEDSKLIAFQEYLTAEDYSIKDEYTQRAMEYIKENYARNISVRTIALALNISESHLSKVFKETMHNTLGEYLTQYRITEACRLLRKSDCKVYEVAQQVGYTDQRYFSVAFKRIMGVTPLGFRNGEAAKSN